MIMKKYIIFLAAAILSLSISSCTKFTEEILDGNPLTSFTKSNYFTSESNVEMFANYFYSEWTGYGTGGSCNFYFPTLNDNQSVIGYTEWNYTSVPASNGTWNSCYTEIRRANIMLEAIPNIESMSETAKKNWMGVARLYRAWQHYCIVRSLGDCYYVDKVLDVNDENILFGARQDRDVVMDKVLEDLNYAVENITYNASSRTAFNNAVAQAMKSEICLYEGTFCKYRSAADGQKAADATRADKYLGECKTASKAIMDKTSMYFLSPSYRAVYNSLDLGKSDATSEMILYKHYVYGIMSHGVIDYTCGSTMTNGMNKDAFDSYLFTDGECLANTTLNKSDHGKVVSVTPGTIADERTWIIDISDVLKNRDPRLSETIDPYLFFPGCGYRRYSLGAEATSSTGYGVMKFDTPLFTDAARRNATNGAETDAPIFWLANVILNYAEACVETNDNKEAIDAVNMLRKRAGMPNLSTSPKADPANNMGVSNLIWEVRRERRVELMFDNNDRYWSLVRWHQLELLDHSKHPLLGKGAYVGSMNPSSNDKIDVDADGYINTMNGKTGRVYNAKHYLAPIPSGQISLNPELGQNYGW